MPPDPRLSLRGLLTGCILLAAFAFAAETHGACPKPCELKVAPTVFAPPLGCATVDTRADDCNCGMSVQFTNRCAEPLDAVGFEFETCWQGTGDGARCTTVPSGHLARISFPLSALGEQRHSLVVRAADGEHRIEVTSTVTAFREQGCSVTNAGTSEGGRVPAGAFCVLGMALLTRLRARSAARARL